MIVVDTTVLVYAKGADHALREPCRRLIAAVADGSIEGTTTVEVIQEFTHVRARRHEPGEAAGLAREYAELLSPLIQVTPAHLDRGLTLFERPGPLGALDAVLAAAALDGGADGLVSADRAFAEVADLAYTFPDAEGVADLLGVST